MRNRSTAIIGSGIAGMAAAIRMRLKGDRVSLFEAASTIGGKSCLMASSSNNKISSGIISRRSTSNR